MLAVLQSQVCTPSWQYQGQSTPVNYKHGAGACKIELQSSYIAIQYIYGAKATLATVQLAITLGTRHKKCKAND